MDKTQYIQKAPQYYALAVVLNCGLFGTRLSTLADFRTLHISQEIGFEPKQALLLKALEVLAAHGAITIITDDFGPTVYKAEISLAELLAVNGPNFLPLFDKFRDIKNTQWLAEALNKINALYDELQLSESDFSFEHAEVQWEPIPLERTNEKLTAATSALEEVIEQIEQNNGYAAAASGEREYVLENLKTASKALKERSQIYWAHLKSWAMEPLTRIINRFGNAAVGVSASAAKDALSDWLKSLIENGFPSIFS